MITREQFNQLSVQQAKLLLAQCVTVESWQDALINARPYSSYQQLLLRAEQACQTWGQAQFVEGLQAHPRIGEKSRHTGSEARLSASEQSQVDHQDRGLLQALQTANQRYEAKFGWIFLIRAAGRSGQEIVQHLHQRLLNEPQQERAVALAALAEITLLRLKGLISE